MVRLGRGVDHAERHFGGLARRDLGGLLDMLLAEGFQRLEERGGQFAGDRVLERVAAAAMRRAAAPRCAWRRGRAAAASRHAETISCGTSKGACGQPMFSRVAAISASPSGAPCVFSEPPRLGAPLPITRLAGDQRRPVGVPRGLDRRGDGFQVMAVDLDDMPAGGPEARRLVHRRREGGRAVDGNRIVVPEDDQAAEPRCPARSIASWLMPSCRQPSPAIT